MKFLLTRVMVISFNKSVKSDEEFGFLCLSEQTLEKEHLMTGQDFDSLAQVAAQTLINMFHIAALS